MKCLAPLLTTLLLSSPIVGLGQLSGPWLNDYGWTKKAWTASDTAYRKIEKENVKFWYEPNLIGLTRRLRIVRGIQKPTPPEAFERLFLEVIRLRKSRFFIPDSDFARSLEVAHHHGDYSNYLMTRLRFLAQGRAYFGTALEPLGDRLLQKEPNDVDVARTLAQILSAQSRQEVKKQQKAASLAKMVYEKGGRKTGDMGLYGECAYQAWTLNKSKQYGDTAKRLLSQYVARRDAEAFFLPSFNRYLKELKQAGL